MSKPFFLTRQSANLMEDFVRETRSGPALFLLYGDPAVGKTRLLQELKQTRLADARVHWINLASEDQGKTPGDRSDKLEHLFDSAQDGDIIIADHFEAALKKTRHQLFVSWSTDGVDKNLRLIIASSSDGFNELRQLAAQYQVRVQSYQMMPLSEEEVDAFLSFYLFPDHPIGKLSMPSPLRKQIARAQGAIGELIEIADHDGSHISTRPLSDNESLRQGSRIILSVLILFALAVGIGWYLFDRPDTLPKPDLLVESGTPQTISESNVEAKTISVPEANPEPQQSLAPATTVAPAEEARPDTDAFATDMNAEAEGETETAEAPLDAPAATADAPIVDEDPEMVAAAIPADVSEAPKPEAPEAAAEPAPDEPAAAAATVDEVASVAAIETTVAPVSAERRFLRELQRSLDWIYDRDETVGMVQILLLGYDNFDADGYFDYLAKLEAQQVDISQVRIFKTLTSGRIFYSVLYGEYASRADAVRAIRDLPGALQAAGPIARSVGGIWEEMQRLDVIN